MRDKIKSYVMAPMAAPTGQTFKFNGSTEIGNEEHFNYLFKVNDIEYVDLKKFGKQWVLIYKGMITEYPSLLLNPPLNPEIQKLLRELPF